MLYDYFEWAPCTETFGFFAKCGGKCLGFLVHLYNLSKKGKQYTTKSENNIPQNIAKRLEANNLNSVWPFVL